MPSQVRVVPLRQLIVYDPAKAGEASSQALPASKTRQGASAKKNLFMEVVSFRAVCTEKAWANTYEGLHESREQNVTSLSADVERQPPFTGVAGEGKDGLNLPGVYSLLQGS